MKKVYVLYYFKSLYGVYSTLDKCYTKIENNRMVKPNLKPSMDDVANAIDEKGSFEGNIWSINEMGMDL